MNLLIKFVDWCLRHFVKIILLALVIFVGWNVRNVYEDKAQRERFFVADRQTLPIRDAVSERFKKTAKFPSDFRPFVTQPRYTMEHSNLGRIAFSVKAEGQRLQILFDPDQGPFADKVFVIEGTETNGTVNWSCSVKGVPDRYMPGTCQ